MKSLNDSKKVLVVAPAKMDLDQYIALHSIATGLKTDLNKEVHIGVQNKVNQNFLTALPLEGINVLNVLPPKKFLIEFPGQKNKVKTLQWNQENDKVNFFVSMEKGDFAGGMPNIKVTGSDYETIVMVGVNTLADMGTIYQNSKEVFEGVNIVSVGGKAQGEGLKIETVVDDKNSCVSEDAYNFINKYGMKISDRKATALLAGIFKATNNFKKNLIDAKTFITAADLMKKGATNEASQRIIDQTKSEGGENKQNGGGQKPQGQNGNQQSKPQGQGGQNNQSGNQQNKPQGQSQPYAAPAQQYRPAAPYNQ